MLSEMSRDDRMRLMRFVCSFAWANLKIEPEERAFAQRMVERLELDEHDRQQVDYWLKHPPAPEEVDPTDVPREHRKLFLDTVHGMIAADHVIDEDEKELMALFEQLLA